MEGKVKLVFHVLNYYLPEHIAGTEVYVAALIRALKEQGVGSAVIIPNYESGETNEYIFEETTVIRYAEPSLPDRDLITGKKPPAGLNNFIAVLKEKQPDIVHFHELAGSTGIGKFHIKAVKEAGFRSVITFHVAKYTCRTGTLMFMNKEKCDGVIREIRCSDCWLNDRGQKGAGAALIRTGFSITHLLKLDTRSFRNSLGTALAFPNIIREMRSDLMFLQDHINAFIALTDWYKNILVKNGVRQEHIHTITQGLPNVPIETRKQKEDSSSLRLVFIGRINHFKGVLLLIEALQDIPQTEISLDIYGSATDENYMKQCMVAAKGMNNIYMKGTVPPEFVIDTIAEYDLLCIPSAVSEMGPFVLKEAFAAGVPVLASDVYGNAEQVTHGVNGWLFKFKDVDDLRKNIKMIVNDRSLVTEAAKKVPAVRNFDAVATEHNLLYQKIISG